MGARIVRLVKARHRTLPILALALSSCGSGAPEIPPELLDPGGTGSKGYPPGPYGAEVGDTLEEFSFEGYRAPEQGRTLEEIRFGDFYDPDGSRGITLLLLNTAAVWCQPCQIEHRDLPQRARAYEERGLRILSLLFQDPSGEPATVLTLDAWVTTFETNFPMALDPAYQLGRYGPAETPPLNLVVDPRDMTLIATFLGNQEGPLWDLVERELAERNRE